MSNRGVIKVESNYWKALGSPGLSYVHKRLLLPDNIAVESISEQEKTVDVFVRGETIPVSKKPSIPTLKPIYNLDIATGEVKLDHIEVFNGED